MAKISWAALYNFKVLTKWMIDRLNVFIVKHKDQQLRQPTIVLTSWKLLSQFPANIYLLKVNNRNTRKRCEICSKLTIKTPEQRQWRRSGVFNVNFEHISHFFLVFLLLTSNKYMLANYHWIIMSIYFPNSITKHRRWSFQLLIFTFILFV